MKMVAVHTRAKTLSDNAPDVSLYRQAKMEKATQVAMRAEHVAEQMGKLDDAAGSGLARKYTCHE